MLKKIWPIAALTCSLLLLLIACYKDKNDEIQDAKDKVLGAWNFINNIYTQTYNDHVIRDTAFGQPGDIVEFAVNDQLYIFTDGIYDTSSYTILSAGSMIFNGDTVCILTLNDTGLHLQRKEEGDNSVTTWDLRFNR